MTSPALDTPASLLDRGGRKLAYRETGAPDGLPCFYFHGTPSCSVEALHLAEAAAEAGVRMIATDRPGFGDSDSQPGRTMRDWADDVAALAEELGLSSYGVMGTSGGGPYAMACAALLPEQVRSVVLLAPLAPPTLPEVAAALPEELAAVLGLAVSDPATLETMLAASRSGAAAAPTEPPVKGSDEEIASRPERVPLFAAMGAGGTSQGFGPAAQELALFAGDWGFALGDVAQQVDVWVGELDRQTPPSIVTVLETELPRAQVRVVPGGGHLMAVDCADEVLRTVAARLGGAS